MLNCRSLAILFTIMTTTLIAAEPLCVNGAEPATRPLVVGHRGLLKHAPENTLAGFRAAISLRVGFEVDIRQSRDGRLVCLHDETLDRTTSGRGVLTEMSNAQLRKLDVGEWFDPAFRGERIPTAEEVFTLIAELAGPETLVAVDLKATGNNVEDLLVKLAEEHKILDRLLFIGATIESAEVRARLHAANSKAPIARLAPSAAEIDDVLADPTATWVYVRFLPTAADVERIHQAGKRLFIAGPLVAGLETENWTRAAALPIDGILTDYPLELLSGCGRDCGRACQRATIPTVTAPRSTPTRQSGRLRRS